MSGAREVEYETPHKSGVVPGASYGNATRQTGERVRQLALNMTSAMRSATGSSLTRCLSACSRACHFCICMLCHRHEIASGHCST